MRERCWQRVCWAACSPANASAAIGDLKQKPGPAGCVSDAGAGPCADGTALDGAASVALSPDARSVYVASAVASAVALLDRALPSSPQQPAPAPRPPSSVPLPLACSGRSIALLDVHRAKRRVEVSGLALATYRGQRASIRALVRGARPVSATIQSDGSFRTSVSPRGERYPAGSSASADSGMT